MQIKKRMTFQTYKGSFTINKKFNQYSNTCIILEMFISVYLTIKKKDVIFKSIFSN